MNNSITIVNWHVGFAWLSHPLFIRKYIEFPGTVTRTHGNSRILLYIQTKRTHTHTQPNNSLSLATVLCLPLFDETTNRVLIELDVAWQAHIQNSVILMIHTEDIDLFLPADDSPTSFTTDPSTLAYFASTQSSNFSDSNVTRTGPHTSQPSDDDGARILQQTRRRFYPPRNLSSATTENLVAVAPLDQR